MSEKKKWIDEAICKGDEVNQFFDDYEEDLELRKDIDSLCAMCPVARECFAFGISQKSWGVHGGVYLETGKVSREFNRHKSKDDWAKTWQNLTIDKE
jgi:hypothetical protein